MSRVVVTGAAGFIGSHVVKHLLAQGRNVTAIIEPKSKTKNLEGLHIEQIEGDIVDTAFMSKVLTGADTLFHLAAVYRAWMRNYAPLFRANVEGTASVLLAAQKTNLRRIIYTSSIAAVGIRPDASPSNEAEAFNLFPIANEYMLSKHLGETIALRAAAAGLPIIIVNPAFPFGENDRAPTPTGRMLLNACLGGKPGYLPGGINVVDVDIVSRGHLLAEEKGRIGERYILGDHNISFRDFHRTVSRITGTPIADRTIPAPIATSLAYCSQRIAELRKKPPKAMYKTTQYLCKNIFFDLSKARTELGLPSRPLEETLTQSIQWFRGNGYLA